MSSISFLQVASEGSPSSPPRPHICVALQSVIVGMQLLSLVGMNHERSSEEDAKGFSLSMYMTESGRPDEITIPSSILHTLPY